MSCKLQSYGASSHRKVFHGRIFPHHTKKYRDRSKWSLTTFDLTRFVVLTENFDSLRDRRDTDTTGTVDTRVHVSYAISSMFYDISDLEKFSISQEVMLFFFFFFFFFFLSRVRIFVFWLFPCIKCCVKPRKTLNGSQETLLGSFLWLDVSSNKQRKLAFLNFSPASRHRRDPAFRPFFSRVPTHLPPPTPQQFSDCFKLAEDINHYQLANVVVISGSVQKYILIPRFWRETNFFVFVCILIICSSELPHTTTTKVTPASKYPMKTKVE